MRDFDIDRPGRTRQYKSIQKHHRTSQHRNANKWKDKDLEINTFDSADYGSFTRELTKDSWEDSKKNLWGFLDNFPFVGTEKEQFGFFPVPTNPSDRWHGYPVIPFTKGYEIEDSLLKKWVVDEVLDEDDIPSIKKRKRL
ncbi:hypothetical protein [Bacillus sp. V59.32b]|uniref:hypothetical protein n=1 Tax=Bacillus sp. V59.32b TaxID=1758642 RepID=UPI000E3E931B|nr:hypothetical protein [Bacillus sp. V59.32b]RFU70034.1 hypothetical protein D0463_00745 [Bacillus sp. V59.32b]